MKLVLTVLALSLSVWAQDAIVVPVAKEDAKQLAQKYLAFEKAKAEYEAVKAQVDAKVKAERPNPFGCGVTYSKDFTAAVPSTCPPYKPPPWGGGALLTPAVGYAVSN